MSALQCCIFSLMAQHTPGEQTQRNHALCTSRAFALAKTKPCLCRWHSVVNRRKQNKEERKHEHEKDSKEHKSDYEHKHADKPHAPPATIAGHREDKHADKRDDKHADKRDYKSEHKHVDKPDAPLATVEGHKHEDKHADKPDGKDAPKGRDYKAEGEDRNREYKSDKEHHHEQHTAPAQGESSLFGAATTACL